MRTLISIVFLMACGNLYAANIIAKLDVNPVFVSDTFHLTYTASSSVDDDPDFSPLKNDFEVLSTQQSSSMRMINGDITRSKTWTLTLLAKTTGIFTIPAISFGTDTAAKLNVVVKAIPTSTSGEPNQDYFLELESSKPIGYVQEQFIITVRLLISKSISNYQFSDLTTSNPDSLIIPIGKDKQYKTYRGSIQHIVIEKTFALFPQKSETLKINPIISVVRINSQNANSRFYDPFNSRTTSKRLKSKALHLEIKSIPSNFVLDNWMPSSKIKIIEGWPDNKKFIAGEPITRTITLMAEGLTTAQVTEITLPSIDGLKQYPDKAEIKENKGTLGIDAIQKQKWALIPTHAGSYTLPAISIPWWNTKTKQFETAYIAKRTFKVLPALTNLNIPTTSMKQPIDTNVKANVSASPLTTKVHPENEGSFWFGLSILFLVLWLATLIFWWRSKSMSPQKTIKDKNSSSMSRSLKQLKEACEMNNAHDTKKALLAWAEFALPGEKLNNLSDIAMQVDETLKESITSLNAHLYGSKDSTWHCDKIYTLCKRYQPSKTKEQHKTNTAKLERMKP
ncbi:MAG: BatD family protein [Woeseiaceae bacterium]